MKMRIYKGRGFIVEVMDENLVVLAKFKMARDHNAEQVLRGLVHEGYKVMVSETVIEKAIPDYDSYEREMYSIRENMPVPQEPVGRPCNY
jgi:hypothetical protein